jgi:hypothetical protein
MVTVGLYIYINDVARRIELFEDEKISINSSVQNASDISKVYTDFSQSFTIPANDHNNAIFSHWYESSIDNGYDARQRKKAYIELDTIPFRKGNIQLEKATIKNGVPENYTITFFGSLVSLKDTFANKKLSELDYSAHTILYSPTEVIDIVKGDATNDVKFPLITSNRVWDDENTTTSVDITESSTAILTSELFPALRISKIFESIATNYGISFESENSFLTDPRFTRAFLWLKNADVFKAKSSELLIDMVSASSEDPIVEGVVIPNFTTEDFIYNGLGFYNDTNYVGCNATFYLNADVAGVGCTLNVYKNGLIAYSIPFVSNDAASPQLVASIFNDVIGGGDLTGSYQLKIVSDTPITFDSEILFVIKYEGFDSEGVSSIQQRNYLITDLDGQSTTSALNLASFMPDIKVEDFFSGILKMFNLTCLSYEENKYEIVQLEDWYDAGEVVNVTEHIISDDVDISKLETFKKINFNYVKSESFMNVAYSGNNGFEYGNLRADLNSEGSDYSIQLPFENLLFQKFTGQNLQVGYSLKTDFKPYIPKPIILYDYGTLQTCNFYLKGSGSATNILTYNAFGQDSLISSVNQSINFGIEVSSLLLTPITNTLYSNYYQNYLENIYNPKSRKYNVKAILPISLLTYLKLNNRLVIRDKKYIINNMKIDLTSGEVDFELINDFRNLRSSITPIPPPEPMADYSSDYSSDYSI